MGIETDYSKVGQIANPGPLGALSNLTQRVESYEAERTKMRQELNSGGGYGSSSFGLSGTSFAAQIIKSGSGKMLAGIGKFGDAKSMWGGKDKETPGLSYDPVGDFMKWQGPVAPNFGSNTAPSAPATSSAPSTGPTSNVTAGKDAGDADEKVSGADKKEIMAKLKKKGYTSSSERDAIYEAVKAKAGGKIGEMKDLLSNIPKRSADKSWPQKFAEWYAGKIGEKDAGEIETLVKEHVYAPEGEVKLKKVSIIGPGSGPKKGAEVEEDYPHLKLSAGDQIYFSTDDDKWHRVSDDSEIPIKNPAKPTAGRGDPFTITSEAILNPDADGKDAAELIDYLNDKFDITLPTAPAVLTGNAAFDAEWADKNYSNLFDLSMNGTTIVITPKAGKKPAIKAMLTTPGGKSNFETLLGKAAGTKVKFDGKEITVTDGPQAYSEIKPQIDAWSGPGGVTPAVSTGNAAFDAEWAAKNYSDLFDLSMSGTTIVITPKAGKRSAIKAMLSTPGGKSDFETLLGTAAGTTVKFDGNDITVTDGPQAIAVIGPYVDGWT
ncbi:MAG: hypothetical protein HN337_02410 [Deltaproteobacteria bacterium]|nr:hypothetical protein [Deltaproteobacteria bacterium]